MPYELFQKRKPLALYVPLVAWVGVLVYLSSGVNSISQTARFFASLLAFLFSREGKRKTYCTVCRDCDTDQPRNLAKSVTVE